MQFTELSELNHVVGLMRLAACNSPTFHDRQDSEVDRIYNSSPKMEAQLRNSWIDKMTAFKPQASASVSGVGTSLAGKKPAPKCVRKGSAASGFVVTAAAAAVAKAGDETAAAGKTRDGREKSAAGGPGQQSRRRPSTQVSGRGDKKSAAVAGAKSESKEESATAEAADDAKGGDDGFTFEREEVLPVSFHETSLLDKALKGPAASALGARPPMMGADGSAVLHLTIYLPTRDEMKIDVRGKGLRQNMVGESTDVVVSFAFLLLVVPATSCTTCRPLMRRFRSYCVCTRRTRASRRCIMGIPSVTNFDCTIRMAFPTKTFQVWCVWIQMTESTVLMGV